MNRAKLRWDVAFGHILIWTMSTCKNVNIEFDGRVFVWFLNMLGVLLLNLLWLHTIFKHCPDFAYCVVAAFYLQFFDHWNLSFIRDTSFVQKSGCQEIGKWCNKLISPVQTTKQTNNCLKPFINFIYIQLFKALFEFVICENGNIMWWLWLLIHEILEWEISCFLKPHVIEEGFFNKIIHFKLELKKLFSKRIWIL